MLEVPEERYPASNEIITGLLSMSTRNWTRQSLSGVEQTKQLANGIGRAFGAFREPTGVTNLVVKIATAVVIFLELHLVPVALAWDVPYEQTRTLVYAAATFWLLDLLHSFVVGYYVNGVVERRQWAITRRYLRSWFVMDLILVVVDWLPVLLIDVLNLTGGEIAAVILKFLRIAKAAKLLRFFLVLRLSRHLPQWDDVLDRFLSDTGRSMVSLAGLMYIALWFTHLLACCWYSLGRLWSPNVGRHWTDGTGPAMHDQYMKALHFACASLTLGSSDIMPMNSAERVACVAFLGLGLVGSSLVVSILSAKTVEVHLQTAERLRDRRLLGRYLKQQGVSRALSEGIKNVVDRRQSPGKIQEEDVAMVHLLPVSLRSQMRFEIFLEHINTLPLLRCLVAIDRAWCTRMLVGTMGLLNVKANDDVFLAGSEASHAMFFVSGSAYYTVDQRRVSMPSGRGWQDSVGNRSSDVSCGVDLAKEVDSAVTVKSWLLFATLWVKWTCMGDLMTSSMSVFFTVEGEGLKQVMKSGPVEARLLVVAAARAWIRRAKQAEVPTDLEVPGTSWGDLALDMERSSARTVSTLALQELDGRTWHMPRRLVIMSGIDEGSLRLIQDEAGVVTKVQHEVHFSISCDECELRELGRLMRGRLQASCRQPGGVRGFDETVEEARDRLAKSLLGWMNTDIDFVSTQELDGELSELGTELANALPVWSRRAVVDGSICQLPQVQAYCSSCGIGSTVTLATYKKFIRHSSAGFGGSATSGSSIDLNSGHKKFPNWMASLPVYFDRDRGRYFAFLHSDEVLYLTSPKGQQHLLAMLKDIGRPDNEQGFDPPRRRSSMTAGVLPLQLGSGGALEAIQAAQGLAAEAAEATGAAEAAEAAGAGAEAEPSGAGLELDAAGSDSERLTI